MRITNTMRISDFLRQVENRGTRLYDLQNQIASGYSLHRPSDDPVGVQQALMLSGQISQNDQYARNVDNGLGRLQYTDNSLTNINDLLLQLDSLALQGDNEGLTEEDYQSLAIQAEQLVQQLVSQANSQYNGIYIYAGQWTLSEPFQDTQENGVTTNVLLGLTSPLGEISREISAGETMAINIPGDQLFMPDGQGQMSDMFQVAIAIRDTLQNGGEPPSGEESNELPALRDALSNIRDRISGFQSIVGARVGRLNNLSDILASNSLSLTDALSNVEDTDMVQAAMDLQLNQTAYQATLSVAAMIMQPSLLDYLGTA
jgi:flagellar hook-associated protein 3 FlgL